MIDEKNLLPVAAVPDRAALGVRVRNGAPSTWKQWHLADVWLDQSRLPDAPRDACVELLAGARS
jgi:hypothetical protein